MSGGVAYAERLTRDYPNDFRVWRIWGALALAVTMMQEIEGHATQWCRPRFSLVC